MTLEGAKVLACVELMPYSTGLTRNIVQCLDHFDIPLYLSHTITQIHGRKRVEKAEISRVDDAHNAIAGTEFTLSCDTVLLSAGLIPENELLKTASIQIDTASGGALVNEYMETSAPGIFAAGNSLHVHDLADHASVEAEKAGANAALHALGRRQIPEQIRLAPAHGVRYAIPQFINLNSPEKTAEVLFRVNTVFNNARILIKDGLKDGAKVIRAYKRAKLTPGVMEKISIERAALKEASSLYISIAEESEVTFEVTGKIKRKTET